jgi:hypothetical protein
MLLVLLIVTAATTSAQPYLEDRGTGIPTSMFGTYANKGELLIYPYFEYYLDDNTEYNLEEFGFDQDIDYEGKYRASEGLIFLGYGISDRLFIELEMAVLDAKLETAEEDTSSLPDEYTESGFGDAEMQVHWRWSKETATRPELYSYGEIVFPHDEDKVFLGTPDWEVKVGSGVIRGFKWGTITLRAAVEYALEDEEIAVGEAAIEYLKRLSPSWRIYLGIESDFDEAELITEAQWHISSRVFIKLNNAVGITESTTDWAPEVGIMFTIPTQ